jgi:hypothetical protein
MTGTMDMTRPTGNNSTYKFKLIWRMDVKEKIQEVVDRKYEIHLQLYDEDGGRMLL